jgi:hypothetical protein
MFKFFSSGRKRIKIHDNEIFIDNNTYYHGSEIKVNHVFKFIDSIPEIKVFENESLIRLYKIETLNTNPDLKGQFLHSSIIIHPNSGVMIDGLFSKQVNYAPQWTDGEYEGVRLQPFYLSNESEYNLALVGKGLFERGLHYNGTVTPTNIRNICIFDWCNKSFAIQHFHAGFSDAQYFYSTDSKETLIVPYGKIENMPMQLQKEIDISVLEEVEKKLSDGGKFKYYNSFNCPNCLSPYIDFGKHKEIRPREYYGNTYLNQQLIRWAEV